MKSTARALLREAAARLEAHGCASPMLDAECLLAHAWGIGRSQLFARMRDPVPEDIVQRFQTLLVRRARREPVAYITGEREFWSRPFHVTPATLIPRPETEHLIDAVLQRFPDRRQPLRFVDLGTGSGCIAVTLACEYPESIGIATDITIDALRCAQLNARRHQVNDRLHWLVADMLEAFCSDCAFDLIIANPPYIAASEMGALEPELEFEPRQALTDEANGLKCLQSILECGGSHLSRNGWIIVETGRCGLPQTPKSLQRVEVLNDLAGNLRGGVYRRADSDSHAIRRSLPLHGHGHG